MQLFSQPPYKGSRAMLRINGTWITSRYKKEIYRARRAGPIKTFSMEKYKWTSEVYDSIYWTSVGAVRAKLTHTKKMQTCKIMHGWLPVGHMRRHITGMNQCPGCNCTDETIRHVTQCPHEKMQAKRKVIFDVVRKVGKKGKVPIAILDAFCHVVKTELEGKGRFILPGHKGSISKAIQQQEQIGFNMMIRGFLAQGWMEALIEAKVDNPERRMNTLQRMVWEVVVDPLWQTRNNILHEDKNKYNTAENEKLTAKLVWYEEHKEELLSGYDQHLASMDINRIH